MKLIFKLSNCEKIGRVLEAVLDVVAHSHRQGARLGLSEFRSHQINNEFHVAVADGFSLKLCKIWSGEKKEKVSMLLAVARAVQVK